MLARLDLRIARKPGSTVTICGQAYIIGSECFRGGTALCYSASRDGNNEQYIIKEVYPPDAKRNKEGDVCTDESHACQSYLDAFENEVNLLSQASSATYQCAWAFEAFDKSKGLGVMRKNARDTVRLDEAIAAYCTKEYNAIERLKWALGIARSMLTGLDKIHTGCRMLHLDLSLTNIFVSEDGNGPVAFFLDFGEARQLNADNVVSGAMAKTSGSTLQFGAPERFQRFVNELTPAADLFSATVLIFNILTSGGFAYEYLTIPDAAFLIRKDCAAVDYGLRFMGLPDGISQAVKAFLKKGLAASPRQRYQTAANMLAEVERLIRICDGRGIYRELIFDKSLEEFQKRVTYQISRELMPVIPASNAKKILFIGDGGMGKTTFLYHSWIKTWTEAKADFTRPVPIYLSVSQFNGTDQHFIADQILSKYVHDWDGDIDTARKRLFALFQTQQYILFLDGFNESIAPSGLNMEVKDLAQFPLLQIHAASRTKLQGEAWDGFEKIQVEALSEDRVNKVLTMHQRPALSAGRLLETLTRPMFLSLYLKLNPSRLDGDISMPGEILNEYWKHLFAQFRDANHLNRDVDLLWFALEIALPQLAAHTDSLHFTADQLCGGKYAADEILEALTKCGLVQLVCRYKSKPDDYAFSHQIYHEFAKAKWIETEMDEWDDSAIDPNLLLTQGPVEPSVLSLLADLKKEYTWKKTGSLIEKWMQAHLTGKTGFTAQMCVRNLVEAMKTIRGEQMSGCYKGLDLTLTNFYGDSVEGKSDFDGAVIGPNTFISPGHRDTVTSLAYLKSCQWIISASRFENRIIIWDRSTQICLKTIEAKSGVFHLAVSDSTQRIAWICQDPCEVTVYSLDSDKQISFLNMSQEQVAYWLRAEGPKSLHFNADGAALIYTCFYGQIAWDISACETDSIQVQIRKTSDDSNSLMICHHPHHGIIGTEFASQHNTDGTNIILWDSSGKEIHRLKVEHCVEAYSISPNGRYFACISGGDLCLFDLQGKSLSLKKIGKVQTGANIVATDTQILVGLDYTDGILKESPGGIWDIKTQKKHPLAFDYPLGHAQAITVLDSEDIAIAIGLNIEVHCTQTGQEICEFRGHLPYNIDFSLAPVCFIKDEDAFCRYHIYNDQIFKYSLDDRSCRNIGIEKTIASKQVIKRRLDITGEYLFLLSADEMDIMDTHTGKICFHGIKGDFLSFFKFYLVKSQNMVIAENDKCHEILLIDLIGKTHRVLSGLGLWTEEIDPNAPKYLKTSIAVKNREPQRNDSASGGPSSLLSDFERKKLKTCIRDIHAIFEDAPLMISAHDNGMLALWQITTDNIKKMSDFSLCNEPIDQIAVIPNTRSFLAVSETEQVFFCTANGQNLECESSWSVAGDLLIIPDEQSAQLVNDRFIREIVPVSPDKSYIVFWKAGPSGILVDHHSGKILLCGNINYPHRVLVSHNQSTFVINNGFVMNKGDFFVYDTKSGQLRWKGTPDLLPDRRFSTISDCGTWLVLSSENGDMQVFNTYTGETFLWPKADSKFYGCDFTKSIMDDNLKKLIKMNGGIVAD